MAVSLVDLQSADGASQSPVSVLAARVAQLVGEPFRFVRMSYGDELTIHFGDLRPASSPKLKGKEYGAYILGVRASLWVLKSAATPAAVFGGVEADAAGSMGRLLSSSEIESGTFIEPQSRVVSATPFEVKPALGFGLQLKFADGSALTILPEQHADGDDAALPEIGDWELLGPHGTLTAGPGVTWRFDAKKGDGI